jgi:hypothetical protein
MATCLEEIYIKSTYPDAVNVKAVCGADLVTLPPKYGRVTPKTTKRPQSQLLMSQKSSAEKSTAGNPALERGCGCLPRGDPQLTKTQFALRPHVLQIRSRNPPNLATLLPKRQKSCKVKCSSTLHRQLLMFKVKC